MRYDRSISSVSALVVAIVLTTGCRGPWSSGWKVSDMWDIDYTPWSKDEPRPETPTRLVGTWTDTVLHTSGKNPQRGFGGRLIFYAKDPEKPVLVDGQLVVYAFDETNRELSDNKPTRRYVFPPDQVRRRMSETEVGPSYSFWLPWDEVGGSQTEVSLIARFQPVDGATIVGEQTKHLLPGELNATQFAGRSAPKLPDGIPMRPAAPQLSSAAPPAESGDRGVQLASYEPPAEQLPRRMTTTSISLPESFRVRNGAAATTVQGGLATAPHPTSAAVRGSGPAAVQPIPSPTKTFPAFALPQQSPLGNGFVAPAGQAIAQPVSSATAAAPVAWGVSPQAVAQFPAQQPSFDSPPTPPQAHATPAFR